MAKRKEPYITIPISFFSNLKIKMMIAKLGKTAVMDYLLILTKHIEFEEYDFMIPDEMIPFIAQESGTEEIELRRTIAYCLREGFFTGITKTDGTEFFFNEDQRLNLLNWKEIRKMRSEIGKKGNEIRWNKGEQNNNGE